MDDKLKVEIKKGNRESFEKLFKELYNDLFAYAYVFTENKELAEEIVLDVFTNLWINRKKITIYESLRAYLLKSVKNRAISALRKKKNDFLNDDFLKNYTNDCNPEKKIITNEEKQKITDALQLIPPRSREIFVLHRFEGLKYKEIAELLEISPNTVENHIVKAMKVLRNYFIDKKL